MEQTYEGREAIDISLTEVEELSFAALRAHRTSDANARCMARSIAAAEGDGLRSHGLLRLPTYCAHAAIGKVDGHAVATVVRARPAAWIADAREGFAHPAIDAGFAALVPGAKEQGIAVLAVTNSYNCGVVGHHVERLAEQGLVALAFANTPAAIAPWGGSKALFGTNPLAFAAPRASDLPLVIDQSSSVVARGGVMLAASRGVAIPAGWALDPDGAPTTDPSAALAGSMLPAGGYKGAGIALMVEILAAASTGASFSFDASSFADNNGGPPRTGQLFVALDPGAILGGAFAARVDAVIAAMSAQAGVRVPGARRVEARKVAVEKGVQVERGLWERVAGLGSTEGSGPHER
jgi:(2R)-3-sulfolactate dehydrogenase (NADP+)